MEAWDCSHFLLSQTSRMLFLRSGSTGHLQSVPFGLFPAQCILVANAFVAFPSIAAHKQRNEIPGRSSRILQVKDRENKVHGVSVPYADVLVVQAAGSHSPCAHWPVCFCRRLDR